MGLKKIGKLGLTRLGDGGEDGFDFFGRDAAFLKVFDRGTFKGFESGDAQADELCDQLRADAELFGKTNSDVAGFGFEALFAVGGLGDIEAPAHELGGQAGVASLAADGDAHVVFVYFEEDRTRAFVDAYVARTGWADGFFQELKRLRMVADDIDLFAAQFLTILRTRAPRAPTQAPTGSTLGSRESTAILVR